MKQINERLHFGCGSVILEGWINVDLNSPLADIQHDLTQPLPFAEAFASRIFSEHFIEHVTREKAVDFLVECRRVLRPGGVIRVSTPNLRFLIAAYLGLEVGEWGDLWRPKTICALMNEGMRSWGHQYLYDAEDFVLIFKEAGFGSVVFKRYQESHHPDLVGLESRPFHHELIVEATKCDGEFTADFTILRQDEQHWFQQYARLEALEKTIADQAVNLESVAAEVGMRDEHIERLEKTIGGLQEVVQKQAAQTEAITVDWTARGEHIGHLKKTIDALDRTVRLFNESWCGKLRRMFAKQNWKD